MAETKRIPSLDGLRAISITIVMLGHLGGTRGFPPGFGFFEWYANFGVRVFFVISGYLITNLLIQEHHKDGDISLKEFYIRRAARILPAAYVYITTVALLCHGIPKLEIFGGYFYYSNYVNNHWQLGHLWSLANEEQFYFVWPFLCAYFFARTKHLAIAGMIIGPLCRVGLYPFGVVGNWFPMTCDALATGCLLAVIWESLDKRRDLLLAPRFIALCIGAVVLLPLLGAGPHLFRSIYGSVGLTLLHLGIACLIYAAVRRPPRWLNHPVIAWVGVLSYSLYLWQQVFLFRASREWWTAFPQNLILAFGAAALSYYLVERPALQFRSRMARLRRERLQLAARPGAPSGPG